MSNIREYWRSSDAEEQKKLRLQELEAYATAHELLILDGKCVWPQDYPCSCALESPYDCWQDRNPDAPDLDPLEDGTSRICSCPCHTYWMP